MRFDEIVCPVRSPVEDVALSELHRRASGHRQRRVPWRERLRRHSPAWARAELDGRLTLVGPDSAIAVDDPTTVFDLRPYPGAPAGDFDVYLKPEVVVNSFAQDLPKQTALALAAAQRPIAFSAGLEPSGVPAWQTIPSWYLIGTEDRIIPDAQQRFMAERAGAQIVQVRASHVSMMSKPNAVARLIVAAVKATT